MIIFHAKDETLEPMRKALVKRFDEYNENKLGLPLETNGCLDYLRR